MATSFPTLLDSLANPVTSDTMVLVSHSSQHINANDAIEALEAKVGVDSSAVATSHDYKISTLETTKAPLASPTFTGTVTLPVGLTGVIRADSGVVSTDSDVTDLVSAASTTAAGKIEVAIASEINTGTDATRAVSPDSLAGSVFGEQVIQMVVFDFTTDAATGDGKFYFLIPSKLNGMNLVSAVARVITAGTTGTMDIQIANVTDSVDMLSTKLTIDSTETSSSTAATPVVIDTTKDDVATNDLLRIDVDAVQTTKAKGLIISLGFSLP